MFCKQPMYTGHPVPTTSTEGKRNVFSQANRCFASFSLPGPLVTIRNFSSEKKNAIALEGLEKKLSIMEKTLAESAAELECQLQQSSVDTLIKSELTSQCETLKSEIASLISSCEAKELDICTAKLRISELEQTISSNQVIEEESQRTIQTLRDEIQSLSSKLADAHDAVRKLVLNRTSRLELENLPSTDGNISGPETEVRSAKHSARVKAEIAPPSPLPVRDWTSRLGCWGL